MPEIDFDVEALKKSDSLLLGNNYDDETIKCLLPFVIAYLAASRELRSLALGEIKNFGVMLAGGER